MSMMTSALDRKRGSSVSFTKAKDSGEEGTGEIHISLAPYVQTYLAHSGQGLGCCGISLPIPFERAAPRSWWNPKFDSEILEEQYKRSAFLQIRLRFRYALIYILLVSLSWLAYFVVIGIEEETTTWPLIAIVFGVVGLIALSIFFLTHTDYYRRYVLPISVGVAVMLCLLSLVFLALVPPYVDGLTLVGHFALCTEILLLIYTVLPMPLYACVGISALYSFAFEFLTAYLYGSRDARERFFSEYTFLTPGNATNNFNRVTTEANIKPGRGLSHGSSNASSSGATGIMTSATTAAAARDSILLSALGLNSLSGENLNEKLARLSSDPNLLSKFNASALSAMNNATFKTINASIDNATVRSINFPNSLSGMTDPFLEESNNYSSSLHNESYTDWGDDFSSNFFIRILMQLCIHLIGVHILIMTFVRMRGTFMKVGQSLLVRRQLEMEKQLKEKMIHSVMPPKVADWLMQESEREREREDSLKKGSIPSNNTDIRSLFRPFNMHSMENVSILFADIVGFTKMSSNKTAEELVGILNDLFERFDELCEQHGCEKISTLGDCYYCVTGCPEPRPDHAKCCIEMGLAMIEAIKQFDIERREGVNMRVGVHTGTVLCGIVGTKRFKFDVWSNDVTLANKLESTGKPGRVHLSQQTLSYLNDQYITEEGEIISDVKTYFVKARKSDILGQFAFNSSPKSVSPIMQTRHRLASYNNQSKSRHHYLHMVTNANTYKIKANSLPSILDSENDGDTTDATENASKSPVSIGSYGKRRICQKPWKYLQRQRTTEEMTPLDREEARQMKDEKSKSEVHSYVDHNGFRRNSLKSDVEMDPNPLPSSPLLSGQEVASCTSSVCSRKDSGIRSTSRRSSIQQQLFLMNGMAQGDLLTHRVSGYYTSSSTLNSAQEGTCSAVPPYPFPPVVTDTFGACFHKLRKQSDLQLIRCVQDNVSSQRSYFVKPPLSGVTLFFKNKDMEKEYRENAHKINECSSDNPPTLATSRFNTYFDILISALVYTAITASLFLLCEPTLYYVIFFSIATLIQVIAVTLCVRQLLHPNSTHATVTQKTFKFFSRWYPWHTCGAILVGLPITSILLNFSCNDSRGLSNFEYHYGYLVFVGLVHFCNFTQVNCWMKNLLVTVGGVLFLCLIVSRTAQKSVSLPTGGAEDIVLPGLLGLHSRNALVAGNVLPNNVSSAIQNSVLQYVLKPTMSVQREAEIKYKERLYNSEIFLDMLLLVLLVWFLNREFEISYRLSFHGNAVAARDKSRVQSMKNQADWLLHNIIPKYVADQLKTTAKYSQNHKSVGIIFASIVNFNELYDESYLRGKEYLRVLNELIGDFDELLEKPEYANVEKIKTIGSTFMAASGLNPQVRQQSEHEYTHLFQLMDFALAMHKVIIDFNQDLLGFKLILRIGYNYGDVTAGVIGATKLYYDIWGDAVNIASRMDSTGVAGRVQVASNSLAVLSDRYEFEPRGKVYVKGKDDMDVFLLLRKKGEPEDKNEASSM